MTTKEAERTFHRKEATRCFNRAWDYLDMKKRTRGDDEEMLNLAHASLHHWRIAGTPRNMAVGEWQVSRVYCALGEAELALRFAKSSLSICRKNRLDKILPTAYEAVARAYAVGKDTRRAKEFLTKSRLLLDSSEVDREDRSIFLSQIRDTQRLIDRL